jgi:hypothetical protein
MPSHLLLQLMPELLSLLLKLQLLPAWLLEMLLLLSLLLEEDDSTR